MSRSNGSSIRFFTQFLLFRTFDVSFCVKLATCCKLKTKKKRKITKNNSKIFQFCEMQLSVRDFWMSHRSSVSKWSKPKRNSSNAIFCVCFAFFFFINLVYFKIGRRHRRVSLLSSHCKNWLPGKIHMALFGFLPSTLEPPTRIAVFSSHPTTRSRIQQCKQWTESRRKKPDMLAFASSNLTWKSW